MRPVVAAAVVGVAAGCLAGCSALAVRPPPSPDEVVDRYVAAREHGDGDAVASLLQGDGPSRDRLLAEVGGHPVDVTSTRTDRSPTTDRLYEVTVTWRGATQDAGVDRLLVLPRDGGDPASTTFEWAVSVAP